ncbi:bacillithiol biosynthesis protein BshC, partial [Staphylococcus epidermidis]
ITLTPQLSQQYHTPILPLFSIPPHHHHFQHLNHTYPFNNKQTTFKKLNYHTITPPHTNLSTYTPHNNQLKPSLTHFFKQMKETLHTQHLYQMCVN